MKLKPGIKFKHRMGDFTAEIDEIFESQNEVSVFLTSANSFEWQEMWNLKHTEVGFNRGEYVLI